MIGDPEPPRRSLDARGRVHRAAVVAWTVVSILVFAGCLESPSLSTGHAGPSATHTYGWSSDRPMGLDGGLRLEVRLPATWCEFNATIAGRSSGAGVEAFFLSLPANDHDVAWNNVSWVWSSGGTNYIRVGDHDTNLLWEPLGALGFVVGGSGNMTLGDVTYMLAKNMAPFEGMYNSYPSLYFHARCDAPGLRVSWAREPVFLSDQDMEDGTVATASARDANIAVARGARLEVEFSAATVVGFAATQHANDIEGTVLFDTPSGESAWTIEPGMYYKTGQAGHYGVEVNRMAASLTGCADSGTPCGLGVDWAGFIAGFDETDDPDTFFGVREG